MWRDGVKWNQTFTLFTVVWESLKPVFSADEGINPPQSQQHRVPVVVMAQKSRNEEGEEHGHGSGEKQPRETHLLHTNVSQNREWDGEAQRQGPN